ncbi:MAG: hypothetical protein AVDCRST_MAG19-2412 [uncultured Thermomicrobiales bacterium]|uniref:Uncharacterized protein n=1 Tax=uncultured Thermomicrobiales bacterium TaxID=1645740 RepID=A0A6J4V3G5_9BACT|nr:MAG: hypothetical protein AVDCRST_MAG19-2412 [uncultured Thermomicrobiales bacterium]
MTTPARISDRYGNANESRAGSTMIRPGPLRGGSPKRASRPDSARPSLGRGKGAGAPPSPQRRPPAPAGVR